MFETSDSGRRSRARGDAPSHGLSGGDRVRSRQLRLCNPRHEGSGLSREAGKRPFAGPRPKADAWALAIKRPPLGRPGRRVPPADGLEGPLAN